MRQASLRVALSPAEAIARSSASFRRDRKWTIAPAPAGFVAYPRSDRTHLLEPQPPLYAPRPFPETLAVQVTALAVDDQATEVTARVVRKRVLKLLATLALDSTLGTVGPPAIESLMFAFSMLKFRRHRARAKLRLIRRALDPLLRFEVSALDDPYRDGHDRQR